jgi:DNA-binding transcriptional MerR regulator
MERFSLADLERILGVKAYTIRYWEKEIPLIQPQKGNNGRLSYSKTDLTLLSRVKTLVMDRHFTVEGAGEQILQERSGQNISIKLHFDELRAGLMDVLAINKDRAGNLDKIERLLKRNDDE